MYLYILVFTTRRHIALCRGLKIEHLKKRALEDLQQGKYRSAYTRSNSETPQHLVKFAFIRLIRQQLGSTC